METIKGKEIHVLTVDWVDENTTIRQSVDAFENIEDAKKELKILDDEVKEWVNDYHSNWKREGDGETFIEVSDPDNYYASHAVAKITMCVVK